MVVKLIKVKATVVAGNFREDFMTASVQQKANLVEYYLRTGKPELAKRQLLSNVISSLAHCTIFSCRCLWGNANSVNREIRFEKPAGENSVKAHVFSLNASGKLEEFLKTIPGDQILVEQTRADSSQMGVCSLPISIQTKPLTSFSDAQQRELFSSFEGQRTIMVEALEGDNAQNAIGRLFIKFR